jgi:predicted ATPase/class 3 adenylate cyclase
MHASVESGTVSFLFTDIEGSTACWEREPIAMRTALRRHDQILRAAIESAGGRIFKTMGDSFCAAFADPLRASLAALDAQRALADEPFPTAEPLRVRMAVHVGPVDERDGDYFGTTLNRIARLLSIAHGGQVLLSGAAEALVSDALPPGVELHDLGEHRLKDLRQPEHVFGLFGPGLPADPRPLRSLSAVANNLPIHPSPIVGRERELADLADLVARHRLLTIAGPGGIGKTRVALALAAEIAKPFESDVWFVDFAPLGDESLVTGTIAGVLSLQPSEAGRALESVVTYLGERPVILVFDNCEHVVAAAAAAARRIVEACPAVRLVATSREALGVGGEFVYRLGPLSYPATALDVPAKAVEYDACRLFAERAQADGVPYAFDDEDWNAIGEICRRVDGLPFAVELAASRVRMFRPPDLCERLRSHLGVLGHGSRTARPRQRTIHAMIAWSYDLLGPDERRLLARLAVFSGGWTLSAAEFVCSDDDLSSGLIVELLGSLIDKSLVMVDVRETQNRFNFLETTRTFALGRLRESGELKSRYARHAAWVDVHLREAYDSNAHVPVHRWLAENAPEIDNIRAALRWALADGGDVLLGARCAGNAAPLWYEGGLAVEAHAWIETALSRISPDGFPNIACRLFYALAHIALGPQAVDAASKAIHYAGAAGDDRCLAASYVTLGTAHWHMGRLPAALAALDEALAAFERIDLEVSGPYANALDARGNLRLNVGELDEAGRDFERALARYEMLEDDLAVGRVCGNLAELAFARGDAGLALERASQALDIFRRHRSRIREANALVNIASYHLARDDAAAAEAPATDALRLATTLGEEHICVVALQHLAAVLAARRDFGLSAEALGFVDAWYASHECERAWSEQQGADRLLATLAAHVQPDDLAQRRFSGAAFELPEATLRVTRALAEREGHADHSKVDLVTRQDEF